MEQHFFDSQEAWEAARIGLFTSSEMHRLMAPCMRDMTEDELAKRPAKGTGSKTTKIEDPEGLSNGSLTYIKEKAVEILASKKPPFTTFEMEWGKEQEPQAVLAFAEKMGLDINDPDFLYCGVADPVFYTMANVAGGTPDLVLIPAIGEVKCPDSNTHFDYLLMSADTFRRECPEYFCQIQSNMLFCSKSKCYFISYDPRYKAHELQLKIIEIEADPDYQKLIVTKITKAKATLDAMIYRVFEVNKGHGNPVQKATTEFNWDEYNALRKKLNI